MSITLGSSLYLFPNKITLYYRQPTFYFLSPKITSACFWTLYPWNHRLCMLISSFPFKLVFFLRFTSAIGGLTNPFLYILEKYCIMYGHHNLFTLPPKINEYLSWFHFLACMNKVAESILTQFFRWIYMFFISFG